MLSGVRLSLPVTANRCPMMSPAGELAGLHSASTGPIRPNFREPWASPFAPPTPHINSIFAKLALGVNDGEHHRCVAAVLTFLRNRDLGGARDSSVPDLDARER